MRRLLAVALVQLLIGAVPAAARVRLVGAPTVAHPTVLGDRVFYASTGTKPNGAPTYLLSSVAPGSSPRVYVSAETSVIRDGGAAHSTGFDYAVTTSHLALAELDTSTRGSTKLGSVTLSFSALDGSATQTIASCDQPVAAHAPPFAVDSSRIAFVPGACDGGPESIAVYEASPGALHQIAIPTGDAVHAVALAGNYVAYDLEPPGASPSVVVSDWTTGAAVLHLDGSGGPFALQPDGTLLTTQGACPATGLVYASVADPTPRLVPDAHPCSPLRLTGGHVVYLDAARHLHTTQLNGGDETLVDAPVGDFDGDDTYAAFTFPDCAGQALYRIGLAEPPSTPVVPGACPVRVRRSLLRLRGTRVIVPLSCPRACRGTLTLRRGGFRLAQAPFAVSAPGAGSGELRLSVAARRRLGHGRLPAQLTLSARLPSGRAATRNATITILRPARR